MILQILFLLQGVLALPSPNGAPTPDLSLQCSANNNLMVVGQTIVCTARVNVATTSSLGAPTGSVRFSYVRNDSTCFFHLDIPVQNSVATSGHFGFGAIGFYFLTATYNGNYPSALAALTLQVNQAQTSTVLTASQNQVAINQLVLFTAQVTAVSPSYFQTQGTLTWSPLGRTDTLSFNDVTGEDTLSTRFPGHGSKTVVATYNGNANYAPSSDSTMVVVLQTSAPVSTTAPAAQTAPTVSVQCTANSVIVAQPLSCTATVHSSGNLGPTSGLIMWSFLRNGIFCFLHLNSTLINGAATTGTFGVWNVLDSYTLFAIYYGNYPTAMSNTTLKVTQAQTSTSITLIQNGVTVTNHVQAGIPVQFVATVGAVSPSYFQTQGNVTWSLGPRTDPLVFNNINLSSQDTISHTFTTNGHQTVTATFDGDANYESSVGSVTFQVS